VPAAELEPIRRVLILSADVGSGHLVAARTLAAELEQRGVEVVVEEDLRSSLGLLPRLIIREGSRVLFGRAPRVYDVYYRMLLRVAPARLMTAASLRRFGTRRLMRLVRRHQPDAVVSTYPGVTVVLGELRRRRRLSVPVLAVITDLAGLFFWAHRGVDMHLLAWAESAEEVERISRSPANSIHVLAPTDPAFFAPVDKRAARERQGLPASGRVVLVSGGGWGVGGLAQTVDSALAAEPELVVVLAGNNEAARRVLLERFGDHARVRVLGYTAEMSDLLAGADVLIHATGGVTCLEAALRGCPTIVHGFAVGHVRHNAEEMSRLGLVQRARDETDLTAVVRSVLDQPLVAGGAPRPSLPSAAAVVSAARPRIRPLPRWWLAARRISPTGTALAVALALSTSGGYAMASRVEDDFKPVSHVAATQPQVAVVARPARDEVQPLVDQLAAERLPVTVAVTGTPPPGVAATAAAAGVEIVPGLQSGRALHWVPTWDRLADIRHDLGERGRAPYIAPDRGFTLGEYVLGRTAHGFPVRPLRESPAALQRGDIVEADDWASIAAITHSLARRGLRVTSLSALLAERGS
jgi:UDP-N-acetylglucosamine:LPS N-acetylglucosamine transferase